MQNGGDKTLSIRFLMSIKLKVLLCFIMVNNSPQKNVIVIGGRIHEKIMNWANNELGIRLRKAMEGNASEAAAVLLALLSR